MNIFTQLDERDRQTLADYVRSQTVTTRPKSHASVAPSAVKKSSRKNAMAESGVNTEDATGNVSVVGANGSFCGMCGHEADYQDHFQPSPQFHKFYTGKKPKVSAA